MNEIITLLPLITVFIIFYVILYIPQRRRQKKHKEYVDVSYKHLRAHETIQDLV